MSRVLLDLNHIPFQGDWFSMEREEALAVLATFKKIRQLDWSQLYADRGLRWEAILSRLGPGGKRLYSLRVTKRTRAVAFREGDYLCLLSLHPDHDSVIRRYDHCRNISSIHERKTSATWSFRSKCSLPSTASSCGKHQLAKSFYN